jgi:hypothetical protein
MTPSRRAIGVVAASLTLAALPAAAIAVPTTQVGARNAMLVPGDARAAGLPASLVEIFEPVFNEKIWVCDAKGPSDVHATAPPVTYVADTLQFANGLETDLSQDISVFRSAADASAVFATVVSKARTCKGTVVSTEDGPRKQKTIRRSNGTAPFAFGGQQAVWISQLTPGPGGVKALNDAQYQVFLLNGAVIQAVEFEQIGASATKVSSANRARVNQLAQTLAQRWTVAP